MSNRDNFKDKSENEVLENIVNPLMDAAISLAYRNSDFICEDCFRTINTYKDIISMFVEDDQDYEEFEKEIYEILNNC